MSDNTYPNLRAEKARRGDTLETLAELLGVSVGAVSQRFMGNVDWSKTEIDILCERYQKPYEELFIK